MYSNFEFLREVNRDLYELGRSIEKQVYTAPSAVLCEGTTFLDNIIAAIFENEKMTFNQTIPFWENCEKLGTSGAISDSFKRLLIKTFNQRNRMHGKIKSAEDYFKGNKSKAISMAKALVNCGWGYFQYLGNTHAIKPNYIEIKDLNEEFVQFDQCIVCGGENQPGSFFCTECNEIFSQSDDVNFFADEYGYFNTFKLDDLGPKGYSAEYLNEIIPKLLKKNLLYEVNERYMVNRSENNNLRLEVNELRNVENAIKKYYFGELSLSEIKETEEYERGKSLEYPYVNFYNYIQDQARETFIKECGGEKSIDEINRARLLSPEEISDLVCENSPDVVKKLKDEFIRYVKMDKTPEFIKSSFNITDETYCFLESECEHQIKVFRAKNQFINDLSQHKSYEDALSENNLTDDFIKNEMEQDEEFSKSFKKANSKRRKQLLSNIKSDSLSAALDKLNIKKSDIIPLFGEKICTQIKNILKHKYLALIKEGASFDDALASCEITQNNVNDWISDDSSFKLDLDSVKVSKLSELLYNGVSLENALLQSHIKMEEFKAELLEKPQFKKIIREDKSILADNQLKFSFKNLIMLNKSEDYIKAKLSLDDDAYHILEQNLNGDLTQIKKNRYLSALNAENTYEDALTSANMSEDDLKELLAGDSEFKTSCGNIFESRKAKFIELLKENGFKVAFDESKLTQEQLDKLFESKNFDSFYKVVNNILKEKYHSFLQENHPSAEALELCQIDETWLENWMRDPDFKNQVANTGFDVLLTLLKNGESLEMGLKRTDITMKEFNCCMIETFKGDEKYLELFEIYFEKIVPSIFKNFLDEFSDKDKETALKNVGLHEGIFDKFIETDSVSYGTYLEAKKHKYVNRAIAKGHEVALADSGLSGDEFLEAKDELFQMVEQRKIDAFIFEIENNNKNPSQAVNKLNLELEDVYNQYVDGMAGVEEFKDFAVDFERVFIKPMVAKAFKYMDDLDITKNKALKMLKDGFAPRGGMSIHNFDPRQFKQSQRLGRIRFKNTKKERLLSNEEYKLWKKYEILDMYDECSLNLENIKESDMASC